MMRWYSLWIFFYTVGTNGFIIPDDVPTALSVFYSNAPKVKLGTDSRIGWGFRLGDRADAQILLELGPQQYTQRLANQQPFDNPNYPELSSSLDSEDDYNYETSEDENAQEIDEETSVEQKSVANETEAAVIRVEIEAMGNLISKLTDTVNDTNQTDQSESGDRQNEVTNNLIRTLEVKMNEEKEKLRDLELTSSSTVENDIQELEENSSNNELGEIIVKLKKYVEKATKSSGEALDDVAALEIETLKRLIKNLSGISKLDDGKDEELLSNEGDPKNGTTIVEEKIQRNESDKPEYTTEELTQHSNKDNEKLQVIPKFINVTQDNHNPSVENDFQLLTKDEISKSEATERKTSKITEDIEQNKELRSVDGEKEKKESSHTLLKNMEKEESPTDLSTPKNLEKINVSVGMQQNLKPNDRINDTLQEEYNDSNKLNKTADTLIKLEEINKESETLRNENSGELKKKKDYSEKQCYSSQTKVEDNPEDIQLKQALEKLKIKLNKQLENLNLNSTIEKQKFMNNLGILKILQEENKKRNEKHMNKSQNSIILEGSYKGVSLKAYQTLSALWVKQDPKISDIICDAKNETELTGKIINNMNGSIDEGSVKNIAELLRKNAVNLEKKYTKSTENITNETYKEKNETAKYENVEVQNEEKLVKIYEQSNEKKRIDTAIQKVELVNINEQGNKTMSMKNSTRIIEESETKSNKTETPATKSSSFNERNEVVQNNDELKEKNNALKQAENKLSEGPVRTKLALNNTQKPSVIDQTIKITNAQNFKVEQDYKSGNTKMIRVKAEESKYPDFKSTDRIIDEEYKKTMVTMMKAQVPRKNHIFRNWPQTHQGLPSSIKTTNISTTSSNLLATRKIKTNLVKNNSANDLISTGSKMMVLFSKMLEDAKKMNERKNMMKKRKIRGLIPDKMR